MTTKVATTPRRLWHRMLGTSLASLLLVGGGAAALADEHEGEEGNDDNEGDELETAQLNDGTFDACEGGWFGAGKLVVAFDEDGLDEATLEENVERFEVVATVEGTDCPVWPESEGLIDYPGYESFEEDFGLFDPSPEFDPSPDVPVHDGRYILVLDYDLIEGATDYRLEVDWRYLGVEPALQFVVPFDPLHVWPFIPNDSEVNGSEEIVPLDSHELTEDEARANWVEAMQNPIVLSAATVSLGAEWYDEDGDATDAPDEGWEVTLDADGETLTLPGDEEAELTFVAGTSYTVEADLPEDWEVVACPDDIAAAATGTGEFTAAADADHVVCVAAVVEEEAEPEPEPEPEPVAEVEADEDEEDEDVLPETGLAPLGLLALGAGMTVVGSRMVRRRD